MADDTITLTLKVQQDGKGFKLVGQNAEKAAAGLEKTAKGARNTDRNLRGAASMSSNTTKNFSKMQQGISGGLVPAYATLAANVFAVTAAFNLLARNNAVDKLIEGLEFTGNAAGQNLGLVSEKLKEITGNAISAEQAMRTTAVGISAGFSQTQLQGLATVAKGASLALGRDLADAMDRLTRGAAKLEPEILDELGIMVRLDDATESFAATMGKSKEELTQFERRMAFTNAIIEQGTEKFGEISETIEASPFAQLSAAFSDLTKTGVSLLNTALTPVIGFLASNSIALTAVVLAFGASISKTLVGSLQEMAKASADAGSRTAELGKLQLHGLKPAKHMGKAFNNLAGNLSENNDELEKQIRTMQKSSNMTVNMMNKSNPLLKDAMRTRGKLTHALFLQEIATHKNKAAEAIAMIQTHGFTVAKATHKIATDGVTASTNAAAIGQDFFTAALIRTKGALTIASMNLKFFGAAFLTYLPHIMGVVAVLSILVPLVSKLFSEKEDNLSKQLEENTERFSDFNKVVEQYGRSIKKASTSTSSWFRTLKPLAGIFQQTTEAIQATITAAELDRLQAVRRAQGTRNVATMVGENPAPMTFGGGSAQTFAVLSREASKLEKFAENISPEDLQKVRQSSVEAIDSLIFSIDQMTEKLKDEAKTSLFAKDALNVLNTARADAETIQTKIMESTDETGEAIKRQNNELANLANKLTEGVKAYESFNEVVSEAKKLNTIEEFGLFANILKNAKNAEIEIDKVIGDKTLGKAAAEELAKDFMNAYGVVIEEEGEKADITFPVVHSSIGAINLTQKAAEKATKTYKELFDQFVKDVNAVNQKAKQFILDTAKLESISSFIGEESSIAFAERLRLADEDLDIAKERLRLVKKGGQEEFDAKLKVLEAERELLGLTKERMEVLSKIAEDSGMGAGVSAAIAGAGVVAGLQGASVGDADTDMFKTEDDKAAAIQLAKFEAARSTLQGVAKDLKSLGPEGAAMSAAIQGAVNMQMAFSTAFEVMNSEADALTKIQAGLGAVGSMVSALGALQKANSDDRIRAIDQEIAAEKRRDGTSSESVSKIGALEKKKEAQQRKAFEENKKMKLAMTAINTASGALAAYTSAMESGIPAPFNQILGAAMAAAVVAMGAKQMAMISSTSFNGGASASSGAPSSISVGNRSNSVDLARARSPSGELAFARGERGTGSGMTNFTPAFYGKKMSRATGGYVVGEQGPELFMPEMPGEIIPSGQRMGGVTNVNFSINAVDSRGVEDLLMNQRGNIISMIRESANANGELFLENVNTNAMEMR